MSTSGRPGRMDGKIVVVTGAGSGIGRAVEVLVNVAGVHDQMEPNEELTQKTWDRILDINLRGTAFLIRRVLREMLPAGSGAIVNTASTAALVAGGGGVAYSASKGALLSLTRQVAYEVAARGVRVN